MKEWHTLAEFEALLQIPRKTLEYRAKCENWPSRPRTGSGGGKEYPVEALPKKAQKAYLKRVLKAVPAPVASPAPPQAAEELQDWQRKVMEARATILSEIDRLTLITSRNQAVKVVIDAAKRGELRPDLMAMVEAANAKSGAARTLSRGRIYEWLRLRTKHGVEGLAPRAQPVKGTPEWASALMELYARPQKPSLAYCVERLQAEAPAIAPTYAQAARFVRNLDAITRAHGRYGPRAIKARKACVSRDTSGLEPASVYTADGHTFDAEVAHPIHGQPFRPEITTVLDVFTRRVVGWSVAISENTWGVMDAIRHAFETSGICAIWYVDNGKGYNNKVFDGAIKSPEVTGMLGRFGVTKHNSLPYNSQARGLIERAHQSIWVRGAKELPTFLGADMDAEAQKKISKLVELDYDKTGQSSLVMSWADFIKWCDDQVLAYNTRSHSSLPRVRGLNGKPRHMSPNELWATSIKSEHDIEVVTAADADLFRPYERRRCNRAEVSLFGNTYFSMALEPFHGRDVLVGYDIHDASKVWVRDKDHRLIGVAQFGGNKQSYFPVSVLEQARQTRAKARSLRLVKKQEEIDAELNPGIFLESKVTPLSEEEKAIGDAVYAEIEAKAAEDQKTGPHLTLVTGRPNFENEFQWAQWLSLHADEAEDEDRAFLKEWLRVPSFVFQLEASKVDVQALKRIRDGVEATGGQ